MKITKDKDYNLVDLTLVKQHLRIHSTFTDDDDYLNNLISTAINIAEDFTGEDIATTTSEITDKINGNEYIIPFLVNDVTGTTINEESVTPKEIKYKYNYTSIVFDKSYNDADITINYTGGYTSQTLPNPVKHAVLIKIGELYDIDRSGYVQNNIKYSNAFEALLSVHKNLYN